MSEKARRTEVTWIGRYEWLRTRTLEFSMRLARNRTRPVRRRSTRGPAGAAHRILDERLLAVEQRADVEHHPLVADARQDGHRGLAQARGEALRPARRAEGDDRALELEPRQRSPADGAALGLHLHHGVAGDLGEAASQAPGALGELRGRGEELPEGGNLPLGPPLQAGGEG